jgi:hypothetical protein
MSEVPRVEKLTDNKTQYRRAQSRERRAKRKKKTEYCGFDG